MVASLRLAVDAWPVVEVAAGDGETHCSKVRSDIVRDGPSCGAKQRQGHAIYPTLEQQASSHVRAPYLVCRVGRARETNSLHPHTVLCPNEQLID